MKVKRRSRQLKLHYSGYRPKCKKGEHVLSVTLTGMTTTWSNDRIAPSGSFDSDAQTLMLDDGASACITNDANDFIEHPKGLTKR